MNQKDQLKHVLEVLAPHLAADDGEKSGSIVVMMCGVSGAGKSTLSSAIVDAFPSFTRLSIDAIVADHHGIYNVDYPPAQYELYLEEARQMFSESTLELLGKNKDVVLDRSFYAKKHRDEYKAIIEQSGGRVILVYLKGDRDVLWRRICERRAKGIDADSAREISSGLLDQFMKDFEVPKGEGEVVINVE
ncbi:P-loop containing nucleoside triphosphate hydrolase protein [Microthyrium microscopicum]|uniref:P-loop containing nucleoside triphosphate hydrolase protein n=1 Tax=Microthyrium microscopicum TaxID=703497 RepID=A0A6A6U6U0_9PEZI|nr:P-loop containing nucleoside triphosphate hydrolase protein [Microthyrium microscopicum]